MISPQPSVSIIIPAYNSRKTLAACLASACAQTYPDIEVVVVDDASTDGCADVTRDSPATLVRHRVNRGVSAARNTGVGASHGEVLFFLDSDVALAPDAVAAAVRELREHPECGCVFGGYDKQPLFGHGWVERYRILHVHFALRRVAGPAETALFALAAVPRAVFERVGPFDERLRSAEDDDYSERLLPHAGIWASVAMSGRHNDEDRLGALLSEQFRRSQLLPYVARNRYRRHAIRLNSTAGALAAGLSVTTLPLGLLAPPLFAVPIVCFGLFTVANPRLSYFVLRERGPVFLGFFTVVHLLVNLALVAGLLVGTVRAAAGRIASPRTRRASRPSTP
jgi:glycosyltransferase involved in cell wall biosynthesis